MSTANVSEAPSRGAVSSGHPEATSAAVRILAAGGTAADATIAAQAVIATVMPHAAGLGGDMLALIHGPGGSVHAVNGLGRSPAVRPPVYAADGGSSVTVPGLVDGWVVMHRRWGRLPLTEVLADAIRFAAEGYLVDERLARAARIQGPRISGFGGADWALLATPAGSLWRQPEVGRLLEDIARHGRDAFYTGAAARSLAAAVSREGGALTTEDLAVHVTAEPPPVQTAWAGGRLYVQPAPSQGVLLAMAARWVQQEKNLPSEGWDHVLVEATEAAFAHRADAAGDPERLLSIDLDVDRHRARRLGGPRGYLHTAGVAVADADGMVLSSLVSVFDDFGSGVFVPDLGIVLNNRAAGFTVGANAPGPGRRPVHTLAPALTVDRRGRPLAVATPGADGQVQTLLQVLTRTRFTRDSVAQAISAPRWRSEAGRLLIESGHPATGDLAARGHDVVVRENGDDVFGAVVAAGVDADGPFAAADWRRTVTKGTA
ncbi:MAG: gamma-glutamyltransferase [Nakamurella sp.]